MAEARFCVGFSKACKQAREGGGLPGCEKGLTADLCKRPRRPWLPPEIVRLIDALVRRLEHEDTLLSMNGGALGRTLCEAAAAGGLRDVRFLLARGADLEHGMVYLDRDGEELDWTALMWAADAGHLAVCVCLLDAGSVELEPALHEASFSGHSTVVSLLLDRGAEVNFDAGGPLMNAAEGGHLATATLLLDRGADIHALEDRPLIMASHKGHVEMVRLLLDRGASIHSEDDRALSLAAQSGHLETIVLLLDRGADLHAEDDRPLRAAAEEGQLEAVRLLLDRGADIHALNEFALRVARQNGHTAVAALLLERGALEPEE
jgi:ankyrin repeat protein